MFFLGLVMLANELLNKDVTNQTTKIKFTSTIEHINLMT